MGPESRDNLIEKIKALFRLSNDSAATEGEAQAAAAKAHELLKKHDLSMTDVELIDEVEHVTDEETLEFAITFEWIQCLSFAVRTLTHCQSFRDTRFRRENGELKKRYIMRFVGTKTDALAAVTMFNGLHLRVRIMAIAQHYSTAREFTAYCSGVASRLRHRAWELTAEERSPKVVEGQGSYYPIVLLKDTKAKEYITENFGRLTPIHQSQSRVGDERAFDKGYQDGENVPLDIKNSLARPKQ